MAECTAQIRRMEKRVREADARAADAMKEVNAAPADAAVLFLVSGCPRFPSILRTCACHFRRCVRSMPTGRAAFPGIAH